MLTRNSSRQGVVTITDADADGGVNATTSPIKADMSIQVLNAMILSAFARLPPEPARHAFEADDVVHLHHPGVGDRDTCLTTSD